MENGFADPIQVRDQKPKDKPEKGKNSPWDFTCPQYDQRTGRYVNAGTHYGVGHRQPVGNEGNPKEAAPTLPLGRAKTMSVDDVG